MVGTRPSVLIYSGHGLQPPWPIEGGELNTFAKWRHAYRLNRRFDRLAGRVAGEFSRSLGNVSDLARGRALRRLQIGSAPLGAPALRGSGGRRVDCGAGEGRRRRPARQLDPHDMREVFTITDASKRQHELHQ
jgi:hypothetical protein